MPASHAMLASARRWAGQPHSWRPGEKSTMAASILVVDDDPNFRDTMELVLSNEGYEVLTAGDGGDALLTLQSVTPDLILLDMIMPVMDGREFAAVYRRWIG